MDAGPSAARKRIVFHYNGASVEGFEGDTVAGALVRAGVHTFSRSMKFHRPRGMYCGAGRCISCVMRVNGVPGVRTCMLPVAQDMVVESQGGLPNTRFDALSAFDHVFRREFEYRSRFIRPRFLAPLYQGTVRRLAASAALPDRRETYPRLTERNCRALIIGQGVSGSVASASLRGADVRGVVAIDQMAGSDERIPSVAFGIFEGGDVGVLVGDGVQVMRPHVILIATGAFETGLPLVNGDLPGVILPAALSQLENRQIAPGKRAVVIGRNESYASVLRNLDALGMELVADIPDSSKVARVAGRTRVHGVDLAGSGRRLRCDTVVVMGPHVPSVELPQQAGCKLISRDGSVTVLIDSSGRTTVPNIFACGGVAGFKEPDDRISSAKRAAESMIHFLGVG